MDDFDTTWLDGVAKGCGADALTPEVIAALLDAAGRAARATDDRRNAPLACFIAGLALGRSGDPLTPASVAALVP